jgi:hypothetical protein
MVKALRILIILVFPAVAFAQQAQQPSADAIAARAIDMLGGAAWPQARYFAFTLNIEADGKVVSSFPQRWDRLTGDYRVSGADPLGNPFEVVMNLNSKKGRVWQKGVEITDPGKVKDALDKLGARRFVNDVFWLLMPLRMTEPGVKREYVGERSDSCGRVWDVVKLTFENGAIVPGDTYWAWVNRDTGIVEEFDMKVQATEPRPTEVLFHDFRRVGGLYISTRREVRRGGQFVRIDDLQILPAPPKGAFVH